MEKLLKKRSGMAVNMIGAIVLLLLIFSLIVCTIGYAGFTDAFKREYAESTYRMADTATALINGDHLDEYLAGGEQEEYEQTKSYLDSYCKRMHVTMMYLIVVDTSDYGRFVSVFNPIDNSVEDTDYNEWELGHKRDTTNDEYRQKYKAIYEEGSAYETVYRIKTNDGQKPHITTLVPVKNSQGEVVAILCMHRMMHELETVRRNYMAKIGFTALGLAVLVSGFYALFVKKQFVNPIRKVSYEATRFAKENAKGKPLGDISKFKEFINLARSIDTMETDMLSYIDNLTAITAEKERIGAELSVASTIQENSIPNIFPAFPERKDFDIYASMTPAKEVGGDFYNFFLIDDDHLCFVIGDVSGKGVPAALFMMVTNILVSEKAHTGLTPAEVLTDVNNGICEHNKADMFVTLWLGILEISTGKVIASNAGHDDAIVYRRGGEFELFKTKHGLVVGAMSGIQYKNFEIQLGKGDKLFLYTDGVPEATDKDYHMFTLERTIQALNAVKDQSPREILDSMKDSVNAFVGDAPQFDDLTMLCFQINGTEEERMLVVDATIENLAVVTAFVDSFLADNDCPMKTQMQIDLALEEAYVNIVNYAYGNQNGKAEVGISKEGDVITLVLKDSGIPYNPLEKDDPDITLSAEEREIGGLGIFLVKKKTDSLSYAYEDGKNILTMKKRI